MSHPNFAQVLNVQSASANDVIVKNFVIELGFTDVGLGSGANSKYK